jgi:Trk-type K+ transport system membrane component
VILVLVQLGGLGIMSASVLIVAMFSRTMGFGIRRGLAAENSGITPGNVRPLLRLIIGFTFAVEAALAAWLLVWLWAGYGFAPGEALRHALFMAVASFNNAGMTLWTDNLVAFAATGCFLCRSWRRSSRAASAIRYIAICGPSGDGGGSACTGG